MITNKNMSDSELVQKLISRTKELELQNTIDKRDYERFNAIKDEILSRMFKIVPHDILLKYVSTPSGGCLLVPQNVMEHYPKIKRKISPNSWEANGVWYLENEKDADIFIFNCKGIKDENIEYSFTNDDISLCVMSPHHPEWEMFCRRLKYCIDENGCDHMLKNTVNTLARYFPEVDMKRSLEYFESHNGICDCKVILNVKNNTKSYKF